MTILIALCQAVSGTVAPDVGRALQHLPTFASGWRTPAPARNAETLFSLPSVRQAESLTQGAPAADDIVCSINAVETELAHVMQNLSMMTKANLVLLSGQNTKLTLRLANVKLSELIRHICAITSLSFLRVSGTYVIATETQLQAGYPLDWATAHPKAAVHIDEEKTSVILINYVISSQVIDTVKTVFGESLKLSTGAAPLSPGISYQATSGITGVQAGVLGKDDAGRGRLIVIRGPSTVVDDAIEMVKKLDYARPQVAIKVTIHDISNDAIKELGAKWSYGDISLTEQTPNGIGFGSFDRSPFSFTAQIKALETRNKAKLLASPNVSVLDGEKAFILIGSRLSYPVLIGYSQANTPIYDKQEERVGIYLQVSASVADGDKITLNIYPQVSTVTGYLEVNGASYPQLSTREAQTTLRVDSGETIVMGGLLRDEDIQEIGKIPLLGDIPILGELFRRRKTSKVSSQVIITITPVVIKPKENESR